MVSGLISGQHHHHNFNNRAFMIIIIFIILNIMKKNYDGLYTCVAPQHVSYNNSIYAPLCF